MGGIIYMSGIFHEWFKTSRVPGQKRTQKGCFYEKLAGSFYPIIIFQWMTFFHHKCYKIVFPCIIQVDPFILSISSIFHTKSLQNYSKRLQNHFYLSKIINKIFFASQKIDAITFWSHLFWSWTDSVHRNRSCFMDLDGRYNFHP